MNADKSKGSSYRNLQVPSHTPLTGADDKPIDIGGKQGAQLPGKSGVSDANDKRKTGSQGNNMTGLDPDEVMPR